MPTLTTRLKIPIPALDEVADGPDAFHDAMIILDSTAIDDQGTFANRPVSTPASPGVKGRYYAVIGDSDPALNGIVWRDYGTGWLQIGTIPATDGPAATGTLRTLGTGAQQAAAGNDPRFTDTRAPSGAAGGDLAGAFPNPTVTQASGAFALPGDISPTALSADGNDYNPTGLAGAGVIRLTATAAVSLTGLAGGADGRLLVVHNVGGFPINFKDENAGSAAGNRFVTATVLKPGDSCELQYDGVSGRWRLVGAPSGAAEALLRAGTKVITPTSEIDLFNDGWTLPGGSLGVNKRLYIRGWGSFVQTADSALSRFRLKYGGVLAIDSGTGTNPMNASALRRFWRFEAMIVAVDATHQRAFLSVELARSTSSFAVGLGENSGDFRGPRGVSDPANPINVDSTVDQTVKLTVALAAAVTDVTLDYADAVIQ